MNTISRFIKAVIQTTRIMKAMSRQLSEFEDKTLRFMRPEERLRFIYGVGEFAD